MNIWLIVPYEPIPIIDKAGRSLRYLTLANDLAKDDRNTVSLWTSDFDHISKKSRFGLSTDHKISHNFTIKFLYSNIYKKNISFARIRHNILLSKEFKNISNNIQLKPDIIFCCLPTLELSEQCVIFANKNNIPIIIDVVDIWPDVYLTAFPKIVQPLIKLLFRSEYKRAQRLLKNANSITAVSVAYLNWALKIIDRKKLDTDVVFPLGYPSKNVQSLEITECINQFKNLFKIDNDSLVFTFIGQFEKSYDIEVIVKAAKYFQGNTQVKFILAGNGSKFNKAKLDIENLDNIFLTGWLSKTEISALLKVSDVGLAAYSSSALQSLPYKPFEYMSAGLPIISSLTGEFKLLIEAHNFGKTYESSNFNSFLHNINWFINNKNLLKNLGKNGYELFNKHYSSDSINNNLIKFIQKIYKN